MSVLQNVETALTGIGFAIEKGKYPDVSDDCGKIVFVRDDKPIRYMGRNSSITETFKVVVRGNNYFALEQKVNAVKSALKNAGFIQVGGLEDVEPKVGETFMQLAVSFKSII